MARNEKSSNRVGKIASKALRGKPVTKKAVKSLAGSVLTQCPEKRSLKEEVGHKMPTMKSPEIPTKKKK